MYLLLLTIALNVVSRPLDVMLWSKVALSLFTAGNSNPVILPDVMDPQLAEVMEAQFGEITNGVQAVDFTFDNTSSVLLTSCPLFASLSDAFATLVARLVSD